jgi:hypothetical protein
MMLVKKVIFTTTFCMLFLSGCLDHSPDTGLPVASTATSIPNISEEWSDFLHVIEWEDGDEAGSTLSLYFDVDDKDQNGKLIVRDIPTEDPTNLYHWNTAAVPEGEYYLYYEKNDGVDVSFKYIEGPILIKHPTACLDISNRPNLLPNPGFEDGDLSLLDQMIGDTQWKFNIVSVSVSERYPKYKWENTPEHVYEGEWSVKIWDSFNGVNSSSAWEDRAILRSPLIDLPKDTSKFLLTARIKTENVAPGHVLFRIKYFDENGEQLLLRGHGTDTFYKSGPNNDQWEFVKILLNPPHWDSPNYPENARAEKIEIGISLDNSPGNLWVDDVSLIEISDEEYSYYYPGNWYSAPEIKQAIAPINFPRIQATSTSVQKDPVTGVWWFVGPDSEAYWAIGTGSIANQKLESFTGLSDAIYRQQAQVHSHYDLNFNIGWRDFNGQGTFSDTNNHIVWLNFSSQPDIDEKPSQWVLKDRDGKLIDDFGHYFPDVFSPIWQEYAVKEAQTLLSNGGWKIKSELVIGYWTDNEIAYGDVYDFIWADVAKLAFVDWLQGKNDLPSVDSEFAKSNSKINLDVPLGYEIIDPYTSPGELSAAWSSDLHKYNYTSFNDVYRKDMPFIRGHHDPVKNDLYQFERVIYKIYVDTIIKNIRAVESEFNQKEGVGFHRPIFSNRFHLNSPAAIESLQRVIDIFSDFDVIAVNWYPAFNQSGTYQSRELMELVKQTFHDLTGRPIFISEFGVAGEDGDDFSTAPYLYVARWRDKTVAHQYQRGWAYKNIVSTWANLPYIIGTQWYAWGNQYGDPPYDDVRNSGLVDDQDRYYVNLTDDVRSINKQLQTIFRDGSYSIQQIDWSKVELNICANK